jgi:hypothetical protein
MRAKDGQAELQEHRRLLDQQFGRMWRSYTTPHKRWSWQQVSIDRQVLAASRSESRSYESCLANDQHCGYVFEPAQPPTAEHGWLDGFRFRDI